MTRRPLADRHVAVVETRELDELVQLLQEQGACVFRCPLIAIQDHSDRDHVKKWLESLLAGRMDWLILMTGEALRRLARVAEQEGLMPSFLDSLRKVRKITRGPKPVRALRELGLTPDMTAPMPTTAGVIAALAQEPLQGKTVGYTLYGAANPELADWLASSGAVGLPVMPYVYEPATNPERVAALIDLLSPVEKKTVLDADSGRVLFHLEAIVFTSSPQVDQLVAMARGIGKEQQLRQGLARTCIAAVGPVVAARLTELLGIAPQVCPEKGFVMKNLVHHLARWFEKGAPE
ncbi:MAG: uroporphyrinogen III synthase [Gemmataceae bacterium]